MKKNAIRCPMKVRTLRNHATAADAERHARLVGNVAFKRDSRFFTCSRSYVCDCINGKQKIEVLCDHDTDA